MKINVGNITPRQKLIIAKGLCDYQYIMEHWKEDDEDFRTVYYDFYLKSRWAVMTKEENRNAYFDRLQSISENENLIDIVKALKKDMVKHSFEFSLASKMLHTRNPQSPIYDSKVREYLIHEEKVDLRWGISEKDSLCRIEYDWETLTQWYEDFLTSNRAEEWIAWFDENFESFSKISDVKKIDFIIFATN